MESPGMIGPGRHMTVQLDWLPEVVDRLTEEARQKGLSLDAWVLQTILQKKTPNGTVPSDEEVKQHARNEAGRSIRELRKGNILGPDLTIRDLIEEGRRFWVLSFSTIRSALHGASRTRAQHTRISCSRLLSMEHLFSCRQSGGSKSLTPLSWPNAERKSRRQRAQSS